MSKRNISRIMLVLLLLGMLTFAFDIQPARTEPDMIIVPDDYSTIQEAVNNANTGDTVFVRNGTYYENLIINKSITLVGESKEAIISQNYTYVTAEIRENEVIVEGFTIQNRFDSLDPPSIPCGVLLNSSSDCQIRNNELGGRYWTGRLVISGGSRNRVEKNKMQSGIYVFGGAENRIEKNVVDDYSIKISSSTLNVIMQNTVHSQVNALELTGSNHNCILYNYFCTFWSPTNLCVWMILSNNNMIEGNTLSDELYKGTSRMDLWASCNNSIFHNNFDGCVGVDENSKYNAWDDGYPSGGNKWIDYDGQDLYGGRYQNETGSDGIGDTPYVIDEYNQDNYPLMKTWTPVVNLHTRLYYSTIQEVIDAPETLSGHAISVPSRIYYEHLVVNKSVSLIGANRKSTIIDGNGGGNVVEITASNVKITGFTIRNSDWAQSKCGICVNCSNGNEIFDNILTGNARGLYLYNSLNNSISGNTIKANNSTGIYLEESSTNVVHENNITSNNEGVYLSDSSSNKLYHNNFMNNVNQVYDRSWDHPESPHSINTWDNDYPSGGNYWSDYVITANDTCRGPYQNITGLDGIGDTSYIVDENNTDNYPLMHPSYVHASVHNVDTGLDYFTIQDAIDAQETTNGHTIKVDKGIYYENVRVNKSVCLIGENKQNTVIDGNFTGTVVRITADNVNVTNFTICNGESMEVGGVTLSYCIGCHINNSIIRDNLDGIRLTNSSNNIIADNFIFCPPLHGTPLATNGILMYSSNENVIANNTISSGYVALYLGGSDKNAVKSNKLYSNWYGIRIHSSSNNTIAANEVFNSTRGIYIASYNNVSGTNNFVYHNNLVNNTLQAAEIRCCNIWHSGYPSGGNYWSDYNDTDHYSGPHQNETGSDGIGDTPYINPYMNSSDEYPLINLYGLPTIKVIPEKVELEPGYVVGQNFTIAIVLEDVTDLFGFSIEFNWNTTYLEYLNHTTTAPVEDYSRPIPPSPYAGILHADTMELRDIVDEEGIPYAEPGTMALIGYSSALPAPSFNGSGTICVFTFRVKAQSLVDVEVPLHFIATMLADTAPSRISHATREGLIKIPRLPPDVAITNVGITKPIVGEGHPTCFNITLESQGGYPAKFNISAYVNTTIIGTITNVTLASGESRTLTFTWNTSGFAKGNYAITVYATPLPNETDTKDNIFVADECVRVTIPGDVDGDSDVDLNDAFKLLVCYGAREDNSEYDANCDIDGDGDIDLYDATWLLKYYGQKVPLTSAWQQRIDKKGPPSQ